MLFSASVLLFLTASSPLVAGHGAIIKAVGDAGGQGQALGVDDATPRDGSRRNPFQQDSTRFRNAAADTCGETLGGGTNDPATQVAAMVASGDQLPQVTPGGELQMTLHQVNGDGAGPYECMIDATGTGTQWQAITVGTNVPGENSRSDARAQDFPLTANIPADQACTGTAGDATGLCMVRCNNAARAGPFGGCIPVQLAGAGNATDAAATRRAKRAKRSARFLA
ncbi:hypothetical protein B0O99DRAFT_95010 [Bisporella sp. PMI_857]|nr:hypothetical protein B0O99DRAFT_95010 [Bisporella sp. PMI_857]